VAIDQLKQGNFAKPSNAQAAQTLVQKYDKGEL